MNRVRIYFIYKYTLFPLYKLLATYNIAIKLINKLLTKIEDIYNKYNGKIFLYAYIFISIANITYLII